MRRRILYGPGLALAALLLAGGEATAMTLYKCIGPDDRVTYLDSKPAPGQCETEEKKDLDPDANVVPAPEFIGMESPEQNDQGNGDTSPGTSVSGPQSDDASLVSGESGEVAPPEAVAPGGSVAGGASVAPGAVLPPSGAVGP